MNVGITSNAPLNSASSRRTRRALAACAAMLAISGTADAQSVWTGTTTSGTSLWGDSSNWLGGSVPTSGATTSLQYFSNTTAPLPSGTITANNDNAGTFTLNRLVLRGLSPATTATTSVVINGGDLAFAGSAPALTLEGQSSTGVLNYTIANNIAFNANTSLGGDGNAGLTLSGVLSGNGTLTKTGASTVQLIGNSSSTFTGGLVLGGGGVTVNAGSGGRLPTNQSVAFVRNSTFNLSFGSGTIGAVEFRAGSGLVQGIFASGSGNTSLTVASVSVSQGATGRFSNSGGSIGSANAIRIANQAVGYLPASLSYSTGPAYYITGSGTAGFVRDVQYNTTPNSVALTGTQTTLGANTGKHVQYTATSVAAQTLTGTNGTTQVTVTTPGNFSVGGIVQGSGVPAFTYVTAISGSTLTLSKAITGTNPSVTSYTGVGAQTTDSIASLRFLNNGGSILLGASQTLTISSGGLYTSGNNAASGQVIAGGSGITTGGATPLYYWSDSANGGLSVQTPILATTTGGLVVTGNTAAIELAAANTFTGGIWLNSGNARVAFAETPGASGPLGASGTISFRGGTLQYSSANTFDYSSRFSADAGQAFSVDTNFQNVTWATSLTSVGSSLTKAAAGNLTLSASNAFTSATVSSGLVRIGDANALGSGTVTLSGGGLATADATDRTINNPVRFSAVTTYTFGAAGAGRLTLSGPVELPAGQITLMQGSSNGVLEISGPITGTGAFALDNGASITLSGNNSAWVPASFAVNNGGITVGHPNALGSGSATYTTSNGGTLVVDADLTGTNSRANRFTLAGALTVSGSQGLTVLGSVTASAADRTLTNNIQADKLLTLAGPVLLRNGTDTTARTITFAGTGNTTISGTVANGGASGSASILKSGTGILRLTAANTYTGTTGISAGILAIGGTDSLSGWSTAGRYSVAAGASLAVQSGVADVSVPTILGTGNFVANAGFGFDTSDGNRTYAGAAFGNTSSGTLNFVKIGSGTLTMNTANTYTGTTSIVEGTLRLGVANAIPSTSPVVLTGNGSLDVANSTSAGAVSLSGSGSILGSATLTGSSYAISNVAGTTTVSAILAGTAATLTKSNAGTAVLTGLNTYRGTTTVSGGVLEFNSIADTGTANASALGAPAAANGTIGFGSSTADATLRYTGTGHTSNRVLNLSGTGNVAIESVGTGPLVLTGTNTDNGSGARTFTLNATGTSVNQIGPIAGTGVGVNKTGPGVWRLTGNSSYTGRLTVLDGTVLVSSSVAVIGSDGAFGKQTSGTLNPLIGDSSVTASGTVALLAEGVSVARGVYVPTGSGSQTVVIGGIGTGTTTYLNSSAMRLGRGVTLQASTGGTVVFENEWQDFSGNGNAAVALTIGSAGNAGTVVFSTVGGGLPASITGVNVVAGTARLNSGTDTIYYATPVSLGSTGSPAALDLNGLSQSLASLSFNGNSTAVAGGTLRLFNNGTSNAAVNVSGTGHVISAAMALDDATSFTVASGGRLQVSGAIATGSAGVKSLTKSGPGILEISGQNTYSGNTTVSDGTLVVNGSLGGGNLSVAAAATLMGSGTIGGAATIAGIHSPGNSPGIETFASDLTYSGGSSQVLWELWNNTISNSPLAYDQIIVGGNLDFTGATSLSLVFTGTGSSVNWNDPFWSSDQTWTLFDVAGTTQNFINFSLTNSPASWLDTNGLAFASSTRKDNTFTVSQQGSDVLIQYTVVVPEPASLALAAIGIAAAAWAARRGR